ncbi:MAG: nitrogen fixation protein NifU [Candidatus Gallionella acididurans]|uniref:Nitrogen fixation protein NifU n=1 Tax=Candidatus Gallionella acididurans TaxID=1796491 RepID=A0A139BUB1_9PROT|nr:MAG: nitrogen fixation protein NifU [Candidatus Gallionella acididurans]
MPKIADIEDTPNPNAVKFVLKDRLTWGTACSFNSAESAAADPLAAKLFAIPHVINVYYMDKWITVTQDGAADWPTLVREIAMPIREAEAAQKPASEDVENFDDDEPRLAAIRKLLDAQVRPALVSDGGDLQIVGLEGNVLSIRYFGACGSCPSSLAGTLSAIGNLARTIEPDIEVEVV